MTGQSGAFPLLDRALNALLMLSGIALSRGDSVGLQLFADRVLGYIPPRSGRVQVNHLLHATQDQFARYTESRHDRAFLFLDRKVFKRSPVILVTKVIDRFNAGVISDHLRIPVVKHLPLAVFLRDHDPYELAAPGARLVSAPTPRSTAGSAATARAVSAADSGIIRWREEAIAELGRLGVLTLDVWHDALTAQLVNRYLEIKARGLL